MDHELQTMPKALRLLADQINAPDHVPAMCLRDAAAMIESLAMQRDSLRDKIKAAHAEASAKYLECVKAYEQAEADAVNSSCERNQASYWKGKRDVLRPFLANVASETRGPDASSA